MPPNKILIIDENESVGNYFHRYLSDSGFEVLVAPTGTTAMQSIRRDQPDLVMLTFQLADEDSLAIIQTIRADPDLYLLPVIMIGTAFDPAEAVTALENGADEYLVRSIKPSELIARVWVILRRCYPQDYRGDQQIVTADTNLFAPVKVVKLNDGNLASELKINLLLIGVVLTGAGLIAGLILWLVF